MDKNIAKTVYKVSDFLSFQKNKSLVLSPSFQRRPVWPKSAKSYLMDSIIQGLPIPIIFLREQTNLETLEPIREVVDGQQRLRTIISFVSPELLKDFNPDKDKFTILGAHNSDYAGANFHDLPTPVKQKILSYEFSVHILPSDTDDRQVLQIFARMNSTGVRLNHQELRNAAYFGVFKRLAYRLAYEQLNRWRDWGIFNETDIARMDEVEETSDLIMMMFEGIRSKSQTALNNFYKTYEDEFPYQQEIEKRFNIVMDRIDDLIGINIAETEFSRKPLFNTLFVFIYDLSYGLNHEIEKSAPAKLPPELKDAILKASNKIKHGDLSDELIKVLRGATANKASRILRFNFLREQLIDVKR